MATVVAVECPDGAVVAGDRILTAGGSVRSRSKRHVFAFDGVAAAAVGTAAAIDAFAHRLDAAVREYRTERGELTIETLVRLAGPIAADVGVDTVVAAHDEEGSGRVRAVDRTGATFDDPVVAFGSGVRFVLGALERESPATLTAAETLVNEAFAAAAERDAGTGAEVDVVRVERDSSR